VQFLNFRGQIMKKYFIIPNKAKFYSIVAIVGNILAVVFTFYFMRTIVIWFSVLMFVGIIGSVILSIIAVFRLKDSYPQDIIK
jgi:hypothetical protein